ncbi:MAG TPA: hypothetical protein VF487_13245 [Chitinophagaceae bacterium]
MTTFICLVCVAGFFAFVVLAASKLRQDEKGHLQDKEIAEIMAKPVHEDHLHKQSVSRGYKPNYPARSMTSEEQEFYNKYKHLNNFYGLHKEDKRRNEV